MTTAFNVETVSGKKAGLPYMETIAARGSSPSTSPTPRACPCTTASSTWCTP